MDFIKTIFKITPDVELPKHNLFCECRKCVRSSLQYIRELRKALK